MDPTMKYYFIVFVLIVASSAQEYWHLCGKHEYKIFYGNDNWIYGGFDEAQQLCGEEGGELAILKDPEVAQCFMNINVDFQLVLLGLEPDSRSSKGFAWTDGTLVEDGYQNWLTAEPDNVAIEDCVMVFDNSNQWRDEPCEVPKHYACQRTLGITSTNEGMIEESQLKIAYEEEGSADYVTNTESDQITTSSIEPCVCETTEPLPPNDEVDYSMVYLTVLVIVVVDIALIIIGIIFWKKKSNKLVKKHRKTSRRNFNTSFQLSRRSQGNLPSNVETNIDGSVDNKYELNSTNDTYETNIEVEGKKQKTMNLDLEQDYEDEINTNNHTYETSIEVEERKDENLYPNLTQDNSSHNGENADYINQSIIDKEKKSNQ